MKDKVRDAKKAAEANLIVRREETAAMRSQANTTKLLADDTTPPTQVVAPAGRGTGLLERLLFGRGESR